MTVERYSPDRVRKLFVCATALLEDEHEWAVSGQSVGRPVSFLRTATMRLRAAGLSLVALANNIDTALARPERTKRSTKARAVRRRSHKTARHFR